MEAEFKLPQPQMCYVPKKDEGKTNVSGKFVGDVSTVHKIGGCVRVHSSRTQGDTWVTNRDLGIQSLKMIVDIL